MSTPHGLTPYERMMRKVAMQRARDGCWLFEGGKGGNGYGLVSVGSRTDGTSRLVMAHRLSYEHNNGPIPDGLCVCHKCDTPNCVNPTHLFVGTQADNLRDMADKGRAAITNPPLQLGGTCARGHRLTKETLRVSLRPNGRELRQCKVCQAAARRRRYLAKKANS